MRQLSPAVRAVAIMSLVLGSVVVAGPTSAQPAGPEAAPLAAGDWPTYHRTNARDGNAADMAPLSNPAVDWTADLDGAVYGQPLVVGDQLFAATENDTVYALNPDTGAVLWSAHLGEPVPLSDLPCGNVNPLGITSTMVYDPDTGRLFALAETTGGAHTLFGLDASTGAVEARAPVEPPLGDPLAHQQRAALTLLNGRIYIPYGGLFGDCSDYIGSVVSVTTDGTDPISYAVPTTREAGIWATAGAVVDGDHLLYSVGNGESTTDYDGSDSVIALSTDLQRADFFAPSTWPEDNAGDEDLGSMSPALVGQYVFADGKRGVGYVLRHDNLGGIGGEVAQLPGCFAFGGSAVVGDTVYLPCTTGPRAVSIGTDGTPQLRWHSSVPAEGSPVVGGGAVWVVDWNGGVLYALDPDTGATQAQVQIGRAPNFASPTLADAHVYVGTRTGVVAVGGDTGSSTGSGACTASYHVDSDWGNGFTATVTVANSGSTTTGSWQVAWTFGGGQQISNAWNTSLTQSGSSVTADNASYNGTLAAGSATSFGFQASYTGTNSAPALTCTAS